MANEMKPRLVRVVDFVAESLEKEASFIPDGDKDRRDAILNMAKVMRASTNPKMVRVWEETENRAVDFIRPDPASQG
jgi:hypothetical protein